MAQLENYDFVTQIEKFLYFDATMRLGAKLLSVYNYVYIQRDYGDLLNQALLCDVAVERQLQITGPDAGKLSQLLTPRNQSNLSVGRCKYILITNANGGLLNDLIPLRLVESHFWILLFDNNSRLKKVVKCPAVH
jgi:glycine cleavage system aminomethyltransferase T